MKGAIFLADGFEEIEAIAIVDVLRRANITLDMISINQASVKGAHGVVIHSDFLIDSFVSDQYEFIVLPGGMGGTVNLMENQRVIEICKYFNKQNRIIGAICAAPMVLDRADVLKSSFTCYPSIENKISNQNYTNLENVVVNDNIITSQGPATAIEFSLELVKRLLGDQVALELAQNLLFK